jgi:TadE-like protein
MAGPDRDAGRRPRGDRGASSIELVLYTPILMLLIFLVVQFSVAYLGNQVASAAAREGARVARIGGGSPASVAEAQVKSEKMVKTVGRGLFILDEPPIIEVVSGGTDVRATVKGQAQQVIPFIEFPIEQVVQGPIERFTPSN